MESLPTKNLIGNGTDMRQLKENMLTLEDLTQITLAVLSHHVDRVESFVVQRRDNLYDSNQIRMVQFL